jgi:hypothetical protein
MGAARRYSSGTRPRKTRAFASPPAVEQDAPVEGVIREGAHVIVTETAPMSVGAKKIPSQCPVCGERLSRLDMESYLQHCEEAGDDPVALALSGNPPGVLCRTCIIARIADGVEHGDPGARRVLAQMRLSLLGVEELPDGKPVRWH